MFRRKQQLKTASDGIKEKKRTRKEASNSVAVSKLKIQNVREITIFFCIVVKYNAHHTLAFYFIIRKESVIIERESKTRKNYLIEDSVRMIQMELTDSIRGPSYV